MSDLSPMKSIFLKKYRSKLFLRSFLIDAMTQVAERPVIFVSEKEQLSEQQQQITLSINDWQDESVKWIPLSDNQEVTTCCESKDPFILFNCMRNFYLMSIDQQQKADELCKEVTGMTNVDFYRAQIIKISNKKMFHQDGDPNSSEENYFKYRNSWLGDIVHLVSPKGMCVAYLDEVNGTDYTFRYLSNEEGRLFGEIDTFNIAKGDSPNYTGNMEKTTVGRYLLNYCVLSRAFGNAIPYVNKLWNIGEIEKSLSKKILNKELDIQQFKTFEDHLFFYGHFTELCVPSFSRKALSTDPNVKKRKEELLKQYAGRLSDPLVIKEIEDILIKMDKDHLKGDTSLRFYGPLGGSSFNIHRKKMYLTVGGIESFSKGSGTYTFIGNSLSQGWDKSAFPSICNEIRKGSHDRGHQTQLGGAQTKYIVRVFQDTIINEEDCETSRGIEVDFSKIDINTFMGHYVLPGNEYITEENKSKYNNKVVVVRSPMTCEAKTGFCFKCVGEIFRKLDAKMTSMLAVDVSSTFTLMALKNMHGTKLELLEIEDLDQFVI